MASPGGTLYKLAKSEGKHGYEGVFAPHGPEKGFHVKLRLDPNSKDQTQIPGPACDTPRDAALRLAKYRANPFPIEKKARVAKGDGPKAIAKVSLLAAAESSCIPMAVCVCVTLL